MEQREYNDDESFKDDYDDYHENYDENIDNSTENFSEPINSAYTPYQEVPSSPEPNGYVPEYMDAAQDYPEGYYQPNAYSQGYQNPHTINYQDIRQDYHNNSSQPYPDTKKLKQKIKMNNENFVMLALLASVVLTSVIIGIGWSLFSPKAQEITLSTETPVSTDVDKAEVTDANDDLIIVYGSNSAENQLTPTTTEPKTKVAPPTPAKVTPTKKVVQKTPISSANVDSTVTKPTPVKKVVAKPSQPMYWIQIFSTTNKDRSIQIKNEFENQGLTPTIITKTIGNKVYYRLRIGPYSNKAESYKFLDWVRNNPSYRDAYVSSN